MVKLEIPEIPKKVPKMLIIIQDEMARMRPISANVIVFLALETPSLSLPAEIRLKPPITIMTKEASPTNPRIIERKFPKTIFRSESLAGSMYVLYYTKNPHC